MVQPLSYLLQGQRIEAIASLPADGVGLDKLQYMESLFTAPTLDAMCALRSVFDPDHRSNPGKVVPIHTCSEWHAAPSARAAMT